MKNILRCNIFIIEPSKQLSMNSVITWKVQLNLFLANLKKETYDNSY